MSEYRIVSRIGTHLSRAERRAAAELLSFSYTKWQNNPKNTSPVKTDTSPPVYESILCRGVREAVLYFEGDALCGVFVHSLSPQYDQYPLRKLSYLGARPLERGFEALKRIFRRYAGFMAQEGEDACITTDLDQATLNALLVECGFREVEDRNETYYLLSQLLARKVVSSGKVQGDFVVDEIISVAGKAVRRNKKLLLLQTTPFNFYEVYRRQQRLRVERSLPEGNRARLAEALGRAHEGLFFVSDYVDAVTLRDPARGGVDTSALMFGEAYAADPTPLMDGERGVLWMLPGDEAALRRAAARTVLRPGFFDFLSYCFKILGSYCVTTGVTELEAATALGRSLHQDIRLSFADMVERILAPAAEPTGARRVFPDGLERTAWRLSGPYVEAGAGEGGRLRIRKDRMVEDILGWRGASRAPVVYLGCRTLET
ncbi:MAG: hypothetical protein AB7D57_15195, partial [Desulfovibrionaceae bacterium]